jgi:hypothetical protein
MTTRRCCAGDAAKRRWFRFAYLVQGRDDRELLPHQTRDAEASLFLQPVLCARGFRYAGPILNYPAGRGDWDTLAATDDSFLRPDDLLVLTTRPPLDDLADGVRHRVHRSCTTLEEKLFDCFRRHLPHCSRARVKVSDTHARASPEVARMHNVQFRQNRGSAIDAFLTFASGRWERPLAGSATTMAYLIFEPHAWDNGPGVLACFGMCGTATLVWNFLLATRHSPLLATVPFVMAELIEPARPIRPKSFDFGLDWKLRFLTTHASAPRS